MTCIILHLFYVEMLNEICCYIQNVKEYDLYITIPENDEHIEREVKRLFPSAYIKKTPNKGQDVGAFLNIIQDIDFTKYKYCFKLHSKKAEQWRKDLFNCLMETPDQVNAVINNLSSYKMIGSIKWRSNSIAANEPYFTYWCEKFKYNINPINDYVSGTIFACTIDILLEILKQKISQEEFEEGYVWDGRKEHAFERLFGKIVHNLGGEICFV